MTIYGGDYYGAPTSLYGDQAAVAYNASPFLATSWQPNLVELTWGMPTGNWTRLRLVRSSKGYPAHEDDGGVLFDRAVGPLAASPDPNLTYWADTYVPGDRWYQYALFVYGVGVTGGADDWLAAGFTEVMVTNDHENVEHMRDLLPSVFTTDPRWAGGYQADTDAQMPRFLSLFGFQADLVRSTYETLRHIHDPERVPSRVLVLLCNELGVPYEPQLGFARTRVLLNNAMRIHKTKGTRVGIENFASSLTGWPCDVQGGKNLVLDYNDSSAEESLGQWYAPAPATIARVLPATVAPYSASANMAAGCFALTSAGIGTFTDTGTTVTAGAVPGSNTTALSTPTGLGSTAVVGGGTFAAATYFWKITATNAVGETLGSTETSKAIALNGSCNLAWSATTGATGYRIYRSTTTGTENVTPAFVASVGAVTAYTDTGTAVSVGAVPGSNTTALAAPTGLSRTALTTGGTFAAGTYFWKVTALNALGETTGSTEVTTAVVINGSVQLAWTVNPNATGYKVYRSTTTGTENVSPTLVATLTNTVTTEAHTGDQRTFGSVSQGIPITGSLTYTASAYIQAAVTGVSNLIGISWFDLNGVLLSTVTGAPATSTNAWTRITCSAVAPTTAVFCSLFIQITSTANGQVNYFDAVQMEWANAATGFQEARQLQLVLGGDRVNWVLNPSFETNTTGWVTTATATAAAATSITRITTDSALTSGTCCAEVVTPGSVIKEGASTTLVGLLPDSDYTVSAYLKAISGRPAILRVDDVTNGGAIVQTASVPIGGGWTRVTLTFTTGAAAASVTVSATTDDVTPGASVFRIDAFLVERGITTRDYFDASTVGVHSTDFFWGSTPHASRSFLYRDYITKSLRLTELLPDYLWPGMTFALNTGDISLAGEAYGAGEYGSGYYGD